MALAYKCDFCGEFYEGKDKSSVGLNFKPLSGASIIWYDICPGCKESFKLWKESRDHNYKTAFEDKEDSTVYGNLF